MMIWTGQMLDPDVPLYNMAHAFTVETDIDIDAFGRAFTALVAGSDALRTVIQEHDGSPAGRVLTADAALGEAALPYIDLSASQDPDAAASRWLEQRARLRFDLSERLYDSALIRLGPRRHVWYLNQ
ncbi:MAG: condensation domain-containing protein, partial [Acidimicrobiales bacterium]